MFSTNTNICTYKASHIYNAEQKSHAQFKHTPNSRSKSLITNSRVTNLETIETFGRLRKVDELNSKRQPFLELSTNQYKYNYQNDPYVKIHNQENFETSLRKSTIRKSTAKTELKTKEEALNTNLKCSTRFLSGTTKSVRFYAQHFKYVQYLLKVNPFKSN